MHTHLEQSRGEFNNIITYQYNLTNLLNLFKKGFSFMSRCRNNTCGTCQPCCCSVRWCRIFRMGASAGFTVTYDANGGEGSYQDTGIEAGTEYTVKSLAETGITRPGYTFSGWNTEAATAGVAPSTSATVGSMSMSTRAGADRPTSARSRATPSTVSPATPCRKERSLSLFQHGTHGIFERKARWPRASASLAAVGELQHALYIAGG